MGVPATDERALRHHALLAAALLGEHDPPRRLVPERDVNSVRQLLTRLARVTLTLAATAALVLLYVVVFTRGEVLR
ncbi:hypothetical protein Jiend_55660 [Micromonospora endophytica]|nr:hypothetical protein Jiend_55660 [Micromonospora endophytica]